MPPKNPLNKFQQDRPEVNTMINTNKFTTTTSLLTFLILIITLPSCASYVNIPPDSKDTAINAVNLPPVPGVMADALAFATTQYPIENQTAIILPAPASNRAFKIVLNKINADATRWLGDDDLRPAYRILSVRLRGSSAIVDILLPQQLNLPDDKYILELNLQGNLAGWRVIGVKRLIPTNDQLQNIAAPAYPEPVIIEQPTERNQTQPTSQQSPPPSTTQTPTIIITDTEPDQPAVTEINLEDGQTKTKPNENNQQKPLHPIQPAPKTDK